MPSIFIRCCRATAALLTTVAIPGYAAAQSILQPVGPVGVQGKIILLDSLVIMLAVVIPTMVATLGFAWWFRASNTRAIHMPDWNYSGKLELLVWSIPTLVILFLGGLIWDSSHDLDPARPLASTVPPLQVQVVAMDWKWLFIYPQQGVASINQLVVPAGTPLQFRITSASVFNSFFVPQLGSQIYAMPGMITQLNLQADRPGNVPGLSAQFSGDGFAGMEFNVQSMPQAQFAQWVAATRGTGPALDDTAYRGLLRQSQNVQPYTYRMVQQGLFDRVVTQNLPPGDGPPLNVSNANVRPFGGK